MITQDGWLDWAIRLPRTDGAVRTNAGINSVLGLFMHSAEGYADTLLNLATTGPLSWHLSNLMDGKLYQHWPFTARCWHATAANNYYIGMECEGVYTKEHSLNEAQINNSVRVIQDLSNWKGWTPSRTENTDQTLWEHQEVVWLGGDPSQCPSGRIPWDEILRRLNMTYGPTFLMGNSLCGIEDRISGTNHQMVFWVNDVEVLSIGDPEGVGPGRIAKNFGGQWFWLIKGEAGNARWSTTEGD